MIFNFFQKYSDNSTLHGIKYIGRANFFILERVFWLITTIIFIALAAIVAFNLWEKYSYKRVEISIETTNFPLAESPFPAVTLCPQNKINVSLAVEYLSRYTNDITRVKFTAIKNVIAILHFLKYPHYSQMKRYLQMNRNYLKAFDNLNITDFMLAVLPNCNELLSLCLWHGKKINCCEVFTLQRTEEGFCYSFNSFTADDKKNCSLYKKYNTENENERKCKPKYLTFAGIHSGLTIFTKPQKVRGKFFLPDRNMDPGIVVILSAVHQLPEAGGGTLLRTIPGEYVQIEVSTSMIFSSKIISRLSKEERGCTLRFENNSFTKYYSLRSCIIGCRHLFIMRVCGCQLYFFYDPEEATSKPLCKLSHLWCIVRYADALKMKTPSKYAFYKPGIKDFPDCSCQTACDSTWYDLEIKRINVTGEWNATGHLNIFYKTYGAIKYLRKFTFSREQLIVYSMNSSSLDIHGPHQRKLHQHQISSIKQKYDKQYKKIKSISLLKEFTQNSTIHGVQHIFREGETPIHRLIWSIFFTLCLIGAMYFIYDSWTGYVSVPIVMSVVETSYPLDAIYFPAVSVCPSQKIVLSKAMEYLAKNLDNGILNDIRLHSFLKALTALQYPLYKGLSFHLDECGELLQKLEILNITELMLKSLPGCNEIFLKCYWRGFPRNCCTLFHIQRSEIGFCYSFNSFTSEKYKNCIYKDKGIEQIEHCRLLTTSGTGPGSGIGILFKSSNSSDLLLKDNNARAMIQVHHPNEYPEPGMGTLIPTKMDKMNILVKATVTESSDDIRKMNSAVSGCYFKDSMKSLVTTIYSQKSCLFECRMSFLIKKCGCLPYYIVMGHIHKFCNATGLLCIAAHKEELRFYRPPSASSEITEEIKNSSLDCTHCLPTCNERHYEVVVIDMYLNTRPKNSKYEGSVDIYYKDTGIVKYQREMSYNFIQLVVNLGGIGGLFLGGSLLSLLEAVYWLSKAFITYLWPIKEKKIRSKKKVQDQGKMSYNQGWLD